MVEASTIGRWCKPHMLPRCSRPVVRHGSGDQHPPMHPPWQMHGRMRSRAAHPPQKVVTSKGARRQGVACVRVALARLGGALGVVSVALLDGTAVD
jgi:hypothetical protein